MQSNQNTTTTNSSIYVGPFLWMVESTTAIISVNVTCDYTSENPSGWKPLS